MRRKSAQENDAAQSATVHAIKTPERRLAEKKPRLQLQLKNGNVVDARSAYARWIMLDAHQKKSPDALRAVFELSHGRDVTAGEQRRLRLEHPDWFGSDGQLLQEVRDVVQSAYRDTPDGPLLVNPFQLASDEQVAALANIEKEVFQVLNRWFGGGDQRHSRDR